MTILRKASIDEFDSPVERLLASIANLRQQPTSKGAHFYRTSLRRFQAWSDVFHPRITPEQQKALNFLKKLRKATGRLRDAELHLDTLHQLKSADTTALKTLDRALKSRRDSYKRRLQSVLREPMLNEIWSRLRVLDEQPQRQWKRTEKLQGMERLALNEYRAFVQGRGSLTPENLHEYRLECKRFRYTAELANDSPRREELIATWKQVQDVIGDWHDDLTLAEIAYDVLGNSPLHSALTELTQQKYKQAEDVIARAELKLLAMPKTIPKKTPRRAQSARASSSAAQA